MKVYKWLFIVLTAAQMVFAITWFFLSRQYNKIIILSFIVYAGAMLVGYITYEVEKYRRRKKELIDRLP